MTDTIQLIIIAQKKEQRVIGVRGTCHSLWDYVPAMFGYIAIPIMYVEKQAVTRSKYSVFAISINNRLFCNELVHDLAMYGNHLVVSTFLLS